MDDDHHDGVRAFISPKEDHHDDVNSKIMITAIISLSCLVVLVTALHIYARCIIRRQARRRAEAVRRLGLPAVISQPQAVEPPKPGLDPSAIASLPIFVFKQAGESRDECAVCLSFLEDGDMARLLPSCSHAFHAECIDKWLASHPTCPICRTEADSAAPSAAPSPGAAPPTAPPAPLEQANSRLSSFRRMLSRERSSRRTQSCGEGDDGHSDIESQRS